jgi:hypothetical protein
MKSGSLGQSLDELKRTSLKVNVQETIRSMGYEKIEGIVK